MDITFTEHEVDHAFARLVDAITDRTADFKDIGAIPWEDYSGNPCEPPVADDFMLMSRDSAGILGFKHTQTRNYAYLTKPGRLVVPKNDNDFTRGYFAL